MGKDSLLQEEKTSSRSASAFASISGPFESQYAAYMSTRSCLLLPNAFSNLPSSKSVKSMYSNNRSMSSQALTGFFMIADAFAFSTQSSTTLSARSANAFEASSPDNP